MTSNKEPRQKIMLILGEGGCYFLSIIHIAEDLSQRIINPLPAYFQMVEKKLMKENCYIIKPAAIIEELYGDDGWTVTKEDALYICRPNEFEILRFEWPTPSKIYSHFVVGDGRGDVHWDPLGESNTVENGELVSKRIFRYALPTRNLA